MMRFAMRVMAMQGGEGGGGGWDPSRQSHPQYDQAHAQSAPPQPGYGQPPPGPQGYGHAGHGPPGGAPPPQQPPAGAKKPNMGLILGGGVGAAALIGGGIAAFVMLSGPPALPVELGQLPETTQSVSRISLAGLGRELALSDGDVPDEAYWSAMSQVFCGGDDVFERLIEADDEYQAERLGEVLADRDDVKATLTCGKAVAEEFGKKGALYRVSFKDGKDSHSVGLASLKLDELPESTKRMKSHKDPDNFEKSYCVTEAKAEGKGKKERDDEGEEKDSDDDEKKCRRVYSKLAKEKVWAEGSAKALKEFGKDFSPEGKNKLEEMELFGKTLNDLKGDRVSVSLGEKGSAKYALPFVKDDELKEKAEKLMKDVKLYGVSQSYDGPFVTEVITFVLSSESEAKDLTEFLEKYMREAKRQLKDDLEKEDEREDKKGKDDEDDKQPKQRTKFKKAMKKVRLAAYENAKAEQKGNAVVLTIAQTADDDAKEAWKALTEYSAGRAKTAAVIVNKLLAGEKPDDADLKALGDKVLEAINPPEFVELKGFDGLHVPGGGGCRGLGDAKDDMSCRYKKLTKEEALKKVKERAEKDGFTVSKREFSDSFYDITKGTTKIEMFIMGEDSEPASMMFRKEK